MQTDPPTIREVGLTGMLVTFGDRLTDAANAAALAFRDSVERADIDGVLETSTSLVSSFVLFDPSRLPRPRLRDALQALIDAADSPGEGAAMPARRLWRLKAAFGGEHGPQLADAAAQAGLSVDAAVDELCAVRTRVLTIGFAPGQPYLGRLPPRWDMPRLAALTPRVPSGALVVALRQLVLFTNESPTGWRHIGRTAFRNFEPDRDEPFRLRPGDEVELVRVDDDEMHRLVADPSRDAAAELLDCR